MKSEKNIKFSKNLEIPVLNWMIKKELTSKMSNDHLDKMYNELKKLGSPGGKIIGAGGGGVFLMAVPRNVNDYIDKLNSSGYNVLPWKFEFSGSKIIYS